MAYISNDEFGYPEFDANGVMPLTNTWDLYPSMLQNITVYRLRKGELLELKSADEEMAVLLIEGTVRYSWAGGQAPACRPSVIDDPAYCLHVCAGVPVGVLAETNSEILVQSTKNDRAFAPVFYTP